MFQFLRDLGVMHEHKWEPSGTGYDDNVKCSRCPATRERRPGDIPQMDEVDRKLNIPTNYTPW